MKQDLPIPEAALRDHIASFAKTGAGKTSDTKVLIEHITEPGWSGLEHGARVCILDPIKSDWWGITSSRDGKRPGRPFQILGGPHGHVPLRSDQGKLVADLVASGALPLSIVDMADFEAGGLQRFFIAFAEALFKKNKGILYLVIEETHEFAPKERSGMGMENISIHWAKRLATAGRTKGIRLLVCSQRTQALHNAMIGSCETMIAGRFTQPADQDPVLKWFKANVSKDRYAEIAASMSKLKNGEAWVACGEADFLQRVQFPRISTYDNTATPEHGAADVQVRTAPVDRGALAEMLRISAEEIDQTDPDKLRARIEQLESDLYTALTSHPNQDTTTIERDADFAGYKRGKIEGYAAGVAELAPMLDPIFDLAGDLRSALTKFEGDRDRIPQWVDRAGKSQAQNITEIITGTAVPVSLGQAPIKKEGGKVRDMRTEDPRPITASVEQRVLNALAELESMRVERPTREIIGFLAGYSNINSKGFTSAIAALKESGQIVFPEAGLIRLTDAGRKSSVSPPRRNPAQIQERIIEMLGGATGRVLRYLIKVHPHEVSRERLGAESGYSNINSKGFTESLAKLKSMDFIEYPSAGMVKAAPVLFLGAR